MTGFFHRIFRKRIKYAIRRDKSGKSARRRAFEAFEHGRGPTEVAREEGISEGTARRYFYDYRRYPSTSQDIYLLTRKALRNDIELKRQFLQTIAGRHGMSIQEVVARLEKPWGLKQLCMGRWPNYAEEERERKDNSRLQAALKFIEFIDTCGMPPEELKERVKELIQEALEKRHRN